MTALVIGHRGAPKREVENSLASFRAAVAAGADGVELDIHSSADGTLFVHHDPRIGASPLISQLTAAQVRALRLPNGDPVPTLEEALQVTGSAIRVYIEVKTLDPRYDSHLLKAIEAGPNPAGYAVHGFDHRIIRRLGARAPGLRCGVLSSSYPVHPLNDLADAGATTLWEDHALIDPPLADALHGAGMQLIAWTVDEPAEMKRLLALGVDALCTNTPEVARRVVAEARR